LWGLSWWGIVVLEGEIEGIVYEGGHTRGEALLLEVFPRVGA